MQLLHSSEMEAVGMAGKRYLYCLLIVIICFTVTGNVLADVTEANNAGTKKSPFFVNLKVDIPVIAIGTLVATSVLMLEDNLPKSHKSNLKPGSVNPLDRPVIGYHFHGWDLFGHIGTVAIPAAMLCLSFVELPEYGWSGMLEDFLIVGEVIAVSSMMNEIVACAMPRPRPYMYRPAAWFHEARKSSWDWRSFYSGHSGAPFAASTAFSYIFTRRYPHSPWVPAVWTLSYAASALVAISRPLARQHFWTDIMVGAAIGTAWGILIPVLHERNARMDEFFVRFVASPGAAGAILYF